MIIDILPVIAYTLQLLPEIIPQIFPYQTKYAVHIVKLSERNHFIVITYTRQIMGSNTRIFKLIKQAKDEK